ncbi:MAG: hypothetical protein ACPG7F_13750, partial [Aggregatilineales bacterium]
MLPWVMICGVLAIVSAGYMILNLNPRETTLKMASFSDSDLFSRAFDVNRLRNNWFYVMLLFSDVLFWTGVVGGGLAYVWNYRQKRRIAAPMLLLMLISYLIGGFLLTAAISNITIESGRMRHLLPVAIGFMIFWGVCIWQLLITLRDELSARQLPAWIVTPVIILFFGGGLLWHSMPDTLALMEKYQQTHVVNVLRDWFDISVPRDGIAMQPYQGELDAIWNRWWGAYDGNRPFEYWSEDQDEIIASTPQSYVDRGIKYFIIGEGDFVGRRYNDPSLRDWMEQLTLIKTFDVEEQQLVGNTAYIYRMLPPQYDADFNYGDVISLDGYDLSTTSPDPGETLTFRPYWRIMQQPGINYTMFIHLYPADEFIQQAQYDGQPVTESYPTSLWQDTEELYVGHDVQFMIPEDLPAGEYRFAVGLYDVNTLQRLKDGIE